MGRNSLPHRRWVFGMVMLMSASLPALADPADSIPRPRDPGLRALDVLAGLKRDFDLRGAACVRALTQVRFCLCLNSGLDMDLSFEDYIAITTQGVHGKTVQTWPADKQALAPAALRMRDSCVRSVPP